MNIQGLNLERRHNVFIIILQVDVVGQRREEMQKKAACSAGLNSGLEVEKTSSNSNLFTKSSCNIGESATSLLQFHQFWSGNNNFFLGGF